MKYILANNKVHIFQTIFKPFSFLFEQYFENLIGCIHTLTYLDQKLSTDVLVEFVDSKISVGVPDDSPPPSEKDSKATEPSHLAFSDYSFDRKLESFILKVAPMFLAQLKENDQANQNGRSSNRMYIGDKSLGDVEEEAVLTYWRLLTGMNRNRVLE